MKGLLKFLYMAFGVAAASLAILLLATDLKYQAWYFLQSLNVEDDGWQRNEVALDEDAYRLELFSPELKIDRIYTSMTGPASIHRFSLMPGAAPELVWMTGYGTEVVDTNMQITLDEAYLCHNNLDYSVGSYYHNWGIKDRQGVLTPRLATITQGQTKINLPEGFGIPLMSNQQMSTATQALNLFEQDVNKNVRHKITVDYVRSTQLERRYRPLYQQSVCVLMKIDTNQVDSAGAKVQMDCRPALASIAFTNIREDGEPYTGHWVVDTGRDTVCYNVTGILSLSADTRLHYAGVHVHPYCEDLELKNLSTG